jgi:Gas vesicle protein G
MDPLTLLVRLPLLPVQGLVRLGEIVQDEVERELHDPVRVRRELEDVERARVRGEASDEDVERAEGEAVGRLVGPASPRQAGLDDDGS